MTTLDIIVLIVFAGALVMGFRKGIIEQAGSLGGLVLGVAACHLWGDKAALWLVQNHIVTPSEGGVCVESVLGNVLLFIVVYAGVRLAAHFVKSLTHALALGFIDRLAGAAFCALEWMLVLSVLFNLWLVFRPETDFTALCPLANGHAIQSILDLGPWLLGFATGCSNQ